MLGFSTIFFFTFSYFLLFFFSETKMHEAETNELSFALECNYMLKICKKLCRSPHTDIHGSLQYYYVRDSLYTGKGLICYSVDRRDLSRNGQLKCIEIQMYTISIKYDMKKSGTIILISWHSVIVKSHSCTLNEDRTGSSQAAIHECVYKTRLEVTFTSELVTLSILLRNTKSTLCLKATIWAHPISKNFISLYRLICSELQMRVLIEIMFCTFLLVTSICHKHVSNLPRIIKICQYVISFPQMSTCFPFTTKEVKKIVKSPISLAVSMNKWGSLQFIDTLQHLAIIIILHYCINLVDRTKDIFMHVLFSVCNTLYRTMFHTPNQLSARHKHDNIYSGLLYHMLVLNIAGCKNIPYSPFRKCYFIYGQIAEWLFHRWSRMDLELKNITPWGDHPIEIEYYMLTANILNERMRSLVVQLRTPLFICTIPLTRDNTLTEQYPWPVIIQPTESITLTCIRISINNMSNVFISLTSLLVQRQIYMYLFVYKYQLSLLQSYRSPLDMIIINATQPQIILNISAVILFSSERTADSMYKRPAMIFTVKTNRCKHLKCKPSFHFFILHTLCIGIIKSSNGLCQIIAFKRDPPLMISLVITTLKSVHLHFVSNVSQLLRLRYLRIGVHKWHPFAKSIINVKSPFCQHKRHKMGSLHFIFMNLRSDCNKLLKTSLIMHKWHHFAMSIMNVKSPFCHHKSHKMGSLHFIFMNLRSDIQKDFNPSFDNFGWNGRIISYLSK